MEDQLYFYYPLLITHILGRNVPMEDIIFSESERETRRRFMKKTMLGAGGLALGGALSQGCSHRGSAGITKAGRGVTFGNGNSRSAKRGKSVLSFITGKDTRAADPVDTGVE